MWCARRYNFKNRAQNKLRNAHNRWGKDSRKRKVKKIKYSRITTGCRWIEKNPSSLANQQVETKWSNPISGTTYFIWKPSINGSFFQLTKSNNYSPLPLTPFFLFTTILFSDIFKHNRKFDPSILKIICNKYEILNWKSKSYFDFLSLGWKLGKK